MFIPVVILTACHISPQSTPDPNEQTSSQSNDTTASTSPLYKKANVYGWDAAEIPVTWSSYANGDLVPATSTDDLGATFFASGYNPHILLSIAPQSVFFGTDASQQVDIFEVSGKAIRELMKAKKITKTDDIAWSNEKVFGKNAGVMTKTTVYDQSADYTQEEKMYFIAWDEKGYDMGLVLRKQLNGDPSFEEGMRHFLQTFDINGFINTSKEAYPKI